jgi:hypothetical protein
MELSEVLSEAASTLGLPPRPEKDDVFGLVGEIPVQLSLTETGVMEILRFGAEHGDAIRERIRETPEVSERETGDHWTYEQVSDGVLAYQRHSPPDAQSVVDDVRFLLGLVSENSSAPDDRCSECSYEQVPELLLRNGLVDRVCEPCLARLQAEVDDAWATLAALRVRWVNAALTGTAAAGVGAAIWAMITVSTGMMYFYLAVAIGVGVGLMTRWGAGLGSRGVQALSATLTIAAVALGQVAFLAHTFRSATLADGLEFIWSEFFLILPALVIEGAQDWSFALVSCLVGAWLSAGIGGSDKIVDVPVLSVER